LAGSQKLEDGSTISFSYFLFSRLEIYFQTYLKIKIEKTKTKPEF
jgi:hypothetical protein